MGRRYFPIYGKDKNYDNLYRWVKENFHSEQSGEVNFENVLYQLQNISSIEVDKVIKIVNSSNLSHLIDSPEILPIYGHIRKAVKGDFFKLHAILDEELLSFFRKKCKKLSQLKMNSSWVHLLPANFAFCVLILPFLASVAMAMQPKNDFIRPQKPSFSVPNMNPR